MLGVVGDFFAEGAPVLDLLVYPAVVVIE